MRLSFLLILCLVLPATAEDGCKACEDSGLVACSRCRKDACPAETVVLACSFESSCRKCGGLRFVPCDECDLGEDALARYRSAREAWLEKVRAIDAFVGKDLLHAESEHFLITYDIRKIGVKGYGTPHAGMHLSLDRLEALFDRFVDDLAADPEKDFLDKTRVLLWERAEDQERASLEYTHQRSSTQSKVMGKSPAVSIYYDKCWLHDESELHQALVHQVAHCLLSNVYDGVWPGNVNGGWLDGGLAHYYEEELFGDVRNYCYVEGDTMIYFEYGRWEPAVRKAVDLEEAPSFLSISSKHTTELTPEEHMFAWSFVDFVLEEHPGRAGTLARAVKRRASPKEALEEALGLSPFDLDEAWREYVRTRYSLKPKRR